MIAYLVGLDLYHMTYPVYMIVVFQQCIQCVTLDVKSIFTNPCTVLFLRLTTCQTGSDNHSIAKPFSSPHQWTKLNNRILSNRFLLKKRMWTNIWENHLRVKEKRIVDAYDVRKFIKTDYFHLLEAVIQ